MDVGDLKQRLPKETLDSFERRHIEKLTPPQTLAVQYGLLEGKNFVISAPTASGKTLIAEMAMAKAIEGKRKAIYVAPMRALVGEKFREFSQEYRHLKVGMSMGDLDSIDHKLETYDMIFVSTEKLDSLIRHGAEWINNIGCYVFDEIHMIDDPGRGPTLEILIARLRRLSRDAQIIALSATIGNAKELAEWLSAELIESDYRPVDLKKGVEFNGTAYYKEGEETLKGNSKVPELRITEDTLQREKQLLIFYSTKRNTESGAEKLAKITRGYLRPDEKKKLDTLADEVLNVLSKPTSQCEKLSMMVRSGAAFHHSGLVNEQRHLIENGFNMGLIKAICSTTTLGFGVNMPAHTVIVRDTTRYSEPYGSERIGINIITQLFGRAGRPKYDTEGRAFLIARTRASIEELFERYIDADLDPVESKLGILPVLRTHVLAFIATGFLTTSESILDFLSGTFYGFEYAKMSQMKKIIDRIIDGLVDWEFLERKLSRYEATRVGNRVSELYIDPLSAKWMIDALPKAKDELSVLIAISNTIEMRPHPKANYEAMAKYAEYAPVIESAFSNSFYDSSYSVDPDPVRPISTAMMLNAWISEVSEREITEDYSVTPGALFTKITNADWLLYSGSELSKILHLPAAKIFETRVRVRYGIKKELMNLVMLEGIGRARARMLFNNGIKTTPDFMLPGSREKAEKLIGKEVARKVYEQLGVPSKKESLIEDVPKKAHRE